MKPARLKKIAATNAAEICQSIRFSEDVQDLLQDDQAPADFLDVLVAQQKYPAALQFLAHALPKREAVWWGCLSTWHAGARKVRAIEVEALKAACRWAIDPGEDQRRAAGEAGKIAEFSTPAGCIAMGAYWSEGSLAPPDQPVVPPPPFLTAQVVASGVAQASTKAVRGKIPEMQRQMIELGVGVAEGKFCWPSKDRKT